MTEGQVVDGEAFFPDGEAEAAADRKIADEADAAATGDEEDIIAAAEADEYDAHPDDISDWEWQAARDCALLDQNDRDNGRRLIIWFGANLLYVSGLGWLTWRETHWQRDEAELTSRAMAQQLVDYIKREPFHIIPTQAEERLFLAAAKARKVPDDDRTPAQDDLIKKAAKARASLYKRRTARKQFAVATGNAAKTGAMLIQAASLKAIDQKLLDANQMLFNCRNRTLLFGRVADPEQDLEGVDVVPRLVGQVEAREHDRQQMLTKVADVDYDEDATCPQFQEFLDRMQPDTAMQRFLQVFHGYAMLMGGNGEQKVAYHFGQGGNGKSVFIETLGRLAGSYRTTVSPETISGEGQRQGQQASPDIARLFNTRFVTVEELPKGVPLKEELVKAFSGGSTMTARFLQKEFFEFDPIFVAVLSGNYRPETQGSDNGIWRRLLIIHWAQTIAENDPSRVPLPELLARFDGERSGILNWLIEGALIYLKDGLMKHVPPAVTDFTSEYRRERDNVGEFAASMMIPTPGEKVQAGTVYTVYLNWCEVNGQRGATQRSFGDRLSQLGYKKETGRVYVYLDVRLEQDPKFDPVTPSPAKVDGDPGWSPRDL